MIKPHPPPLYSIIHSSPYIHSHPDAGCVYFNLFCSRVQRYSREFYLVRSRSYIYLWMKWNNMLSVNLFISIYVCFILFARKRMRRRDCWLVNKKKVNKNKYRCDDGRDGTTMDKQKPNPRFNYKSFIVWIIIKTHTRSRFIAIWFWISNFHVTLNWISLELGEWKSGNSRSNKFSNCN